MRYSRTSIGTNREKYDDSCLCTIYRGNQSLSYHGVESVNISVKVDDTFVTGIAKLEDRLLLMLNLEGAVTGNDGLPTEA